MLEACLISLLTCPLCNDIFNEATTIIECWHTCKSTSKFVNQFLLNFVQLTKIFNLFKYREGASKPFTVDHGIFITIWLELLFGQIYYFDIKLLSAFFLERVNPIAISVEACKRGRMHGTV